MVAGLFRSRWILAGPRSSFTGGPTTVSQNHLDYMSLIQDALPARNHIPQTQLKLDFPAVNSQSKMQ